MAKRLHHKMAIRNVGLIGSPKHKVQLCIAYAPYVAKNPILEMRWDDVTCKDCKEGRWNGVPDGMGLKLVK